MSFFRYPGGKTKLRKKIIERLTINSVGLSEYREPFFGGGSIGLLMIPYPQFTSAWINDKDIGLVCLWKSVRDHADALRKRVKGYTPKVEDFYTFKIELENVKFLPQITEEIVELGFKKLVIHQISYSGLGTKSGGPLGGKEQKSEYKIGCRWSGEYLSKKISKLHCALTRINVDCTNDDFENLLFAGETPALIYLDPPYYVKGGALYQHAFTEEDHKRLAIALKNTIHKWVLSYDDCDEIRDLYSWAHIETLSVNYSITTARQKNELLICPS